MIEIETTIAGQHCRARVTYWFPGDPGKTWGPPEHCWPPEPPEIDFVILDERGIPSPSLKNQLDEEELEEIEFRLMQAINTEEEY